MQNEFLNQIDPAVQPRLLRAMRSLLNAGRDTFNVGDTLAANQSFGKYIGCTPQALRSIAASVCKEMNAEARKQDREIAQVAMDSLRRDLPGLFKSFLR